MRSHFKKVFPLIIYIIFLLFCSSPKRGVIVICAGDSLTESAYPRFLKNMLAGDGIRAKVLNFGRSGNTTGEYLRFLQDNKNRLAEEKPDIICLLLGTNDVRRDHDNTPSDQVYTNLNEIVAVFSQFKDLDGKKSRILLSTIPPIPDGTEFPFTQDSQERVVHEINPLIIKIGKEKNLPVVDNTTPFLKQPGLLPDVHPNEEGYRRLAQNWFEAISLVLK